MQTKDRVLLNKILDEIEVIETVQQTIGENAFLPIRSDSTQSLWRC